MAGQDIKILDVEEAKSVQAKQTAALNGMVEDVAKSVTALKAIDTSMVGNIGTTSIEYATQMNELLQQAATINEDGQKKFKNFVQAVEEVENASYNL